MVALAADYACNASMALGSDATILSNARAGPVGRVRALLKIVASDPKAIEALHA